VLIKFYTIKLGGFKMSVKTRATIKVNESLLVGDHIESASRLFFAIMQSDGNFVVYRGTPEKPGEVWSGSGKYTENAPPGQYFATLQSDGHFVVYKGTPEKPGEAWWGSGKYTEKPPPGQYFAILQDDGNFVVYKGTPENTGGVWWGTGKYDEIVGCEEVTNIDYDLQNAKIIGGNGTVELYRQTVANDSDSEQTSTVSGSQTVSETAGWSNALGVKAGIATSFKAGFPILAEGKVTVSAEISNTYSWNASTTKSKTWSFSTPVKVPPHQVMQVLVTVTMSTIAVPFTMTGTVIFKSGMKVPGRIGGVFTGSNSYDLNVHFISVKSGSVTEKIIKAENVST
jgi:Clostridium epsilon toxin ETX/Bacillus mosquitocidal toxin MTX2